MIQSSLGNMARRIEPLDWLRGFMAISIMLYHMVLFNFGQPTASNPIGRLGIYGVSIFFIISGLTNAVICESSLKGFLSVIKFYIRRLFRILPLFWICVFLTILILHFSWNGKQLFLNLSMLFAVGDPKLAIPIGGWSIGNEMVYYLLTPGFIWLYRKNLKIGNFLTFISFLVSMHFSFQMLVEDQPFAGQFFKIWCHPLNNLFYYLAGVALFYNSGNLRLNRYLNYLLLILFISLFTFIPAKGDLIHVMYGFNRIIFSVLSVGVVFCFYHLEFSPPAILKSILTLFGMATYSVYLLHPIVYSIVLSLMNAAGIHSAIMRIVPTVFLTGLISILSFKYFESFFITFGKSATKEEFIMKTAYIKPLSIASIVCLGIIIYSNTFHGVFQLDDNPSILDNLSIKNIGNLQQIWSFWPCRFLTYLSIALNYHFHQFDVFGYHVFNLIIHLGSALLVYWFILLTFATPVMKTNRITPYANWIALLSSLIFISHPVQTEAVTYIVQRATSLATLFYLLSICLYGKARLLQESGVRSNQNRWYYFAALITTVMAMFTKEMAITLPLMILLYEVSFFKVRKSLDYKKIIPFLLTMVLIPLTMILTKYVDLQHLKRAGEQAQNIDSIQYLLTQFKVILTYLRLLVLPINQNLDYYYPPSKSLFEFGTLGSLLIIVGILYISKRLFNEYRVLSFSIFFFFLSLLPESSILPIKDVIFEHRLYLPMVGFSLFLVSGLYYLLGKKSLMAIGIILTLFIGINSVLTYERNKVWQDMFHLWEDTARKSPLKERPLNNLGLCYDMQGNYPEALKYYKKAMEINPQFPEAYYNSGVVYSKLGQTPQALDAYNKAIQFNPYYANAYSNRGSIYSAQGNIRQALLDYTNAIVSNPNMAIFYKNRANIFYKLGKLNEAIADYNRAIILNPNDTSVYNNMGTIYDSQRNFIQAVVYYTKAIELNSNSAALYLNRGNANNKQSKFKEALFDYNKAIELDPNYADAYANQAVTYYQLKQYAQAWASLHKVEQLAIPYNPQRIIAIKKLLGEKR